VDANFAFYDNLNFTGYYADTKTTDVTGKRNSYQATFGYTPDLYGFTLEHLYIGDQFNPEVGFVRRDDMRRTFGSARFSPRPKASTVVRRYVFTSSVDYIENTAGILESRDQEVAFETEFQSADRINVSAVSSFDRLFAPFRIAPGVIIPVGSYDFDTIRASYTLGPQKRWTGALSIERGSFYDGDQTALSGGWRLARSSQSSRVSP
jgi:hypothetical protein